MSAGMAGCPYIAGPACAGCDGACWKPSPPRQPEPQLCEWCSRWTGAMQECDKTCKTITDDQWIAAHTVERYSADQAGRPRPNHPTNEEQRFKAGYVTGSPSGTLKRGTCNSARWFVRRFRKMSRPSEFAEGQWRATYAISAATSVMCLFARSRSASPRVAAEALPSAAAMTTTDHSLSSRSMGDIPISTRQRAIAARNMEIWSDTDSGDLRLTTFSHSTATKTSATAAYSRARLASARWSASCRSASNLWCAFERVRTKAATKAAIAAEKTAPIAPDQSWTHTSSFSPPNSPRTILRNMGPSLREAC